MSARYHFLSSESQRPESTGRPSAQRDMDLLDAYSNAVVNVVENLSPAVVSIAGRSHRGSGSGFLISADGYVVTNHHVISGQRQLTALTSDGDRLDARRVGTDPANDVALLRLAASDLPFAELGDSDALRVGQLVVAMGSPMGLHSTVSTGVVSAVGRSMRSESGHLIENVIQHAAPINPGNSGGPLVDTRLRVAGINTAIIAFTQGLGFAVPANTVKWVVNELLEHGQVRRPQLGIVARTLPLSRNEIVEFDLLTDSAVEITEIQPAGAADQMGLQPGDVITAINDRIVANVDDVHRILSNMPTPADIEIRIIRRGQSQCVLFDWQ